MATRRHAREAVVALLYAYDLGNEDINDFTDQILEDRKIRNKQKDFALKLFNGVLSNLTALDNAISTQIKEWDYDRIGSIEKALLRLGSFEILFEKVDKAVVINEAIEISKEFGDEKSPKFINGVLDNIKLIEDAPETELKDEQTIEENEVKKSDD